jgi:hypothetical protein
MRGALLVLALIVLPAALGTRVDPPSSGKRALVPVTG